MKRRFFRKATPSNPAPVVRVLPSGTEFIALWDAVLTCLTSDTPLIDTLETLCREIEKIVPMTHVSILEVDDARRIKLLAAPSLPFSYIKGINGLELGANVGTEGAAVFYERPHLTLDITQDPNWQGLTDLVAPMELRTCWSHPIRLGNEKVQGCFNFFYEEKRRELGSLDHQLAALCSRLCALAFTKENTRQNLQKLAYYDPLTNLPNRATILREAQSLLAESWPNAHISLLFIDLDGFKQINDTLGHAVGDEVLQEITQHLKRAIKGTDLVGRLGGDEFLAVIRHDDTAQIKTAALRILHALNQPCPLLAETSPDIGLGASIGIAIYPEDGIDIETLLQRADMAMYRAKNAGRNQISFYDQAESCDLNDGGSHGLAAALPAGEGESIPERLALYGRHAAPCLARLTAALEPHLDAISDAFHDRFAQLANARHLMSSLSENELLHLKQSQKSNLMLLCSPILTERRHESTALRLGRIHALSSLNRSTLSEGNEVLQAIILTYVNASEHAQALSILSRRLAKDLTWQLHAVAHVEQSYRRTLQGLHTLTWKARNYTDLIMQAVSLLAQSDGILGCIFVRPDDTHMLMAEALSGTGMHKLYERIERQQTAWLASGEDPMQPGLARRAWSTRQIERCLNYATDQSVSAWSPMLLRAGIRSGAVVPLVPPQSEGAIPLLVIYTKYPGGLSSREQDTFLTQVQSLLVFAISRLGSWNNLSHTVPYFVRHRWHALLNREGLEMHYQPVLDLGTGEVPTVEALARLRDGDQVLTPGQFFPALSSEDFFYLYAKGLNQALKQRAEWLAQGISLNVAVNLPVAGLKDARYVEATAQALKEHGCPPGALTLETLETEELPPDVNLIEALDRYLRLGVTLSEDDLGSGYSSLSRLRDIPFHIIKIDRSLIRRAESDAFNTLHFVYQLTRLGHSLGKKVIVEGIEDNDMLEAISLLGTDCAQGYAIAKPMPANALKNWLASPRRRPSHRKSALPENPLVKLAHLLIWEEDLQLRALLDDARLSPTDEAGICNMREFIESMPISAPNALSIKSELISSALTSGLHSQAYGRARQNLIVTILQESTEGGLSASQR